LSVNNGIMKDEKEGFNVVPYVQTFLLMFNPPLD